MNLQKFTFHACDDVPEHINIGAGAEHAFFGAGDDNASDFRMLETNALQRVVQFDVDAEIVGVEFQLVAGAQAAVFVNVHRERRDTVVDL